VSDSGDQAAALSVALGIGLLLGVERERRKTDGPERAAAGVRTFALVAFLGFLSAVISLPGLPILVGAFVGALAIVAYARSRSTDPGTTTEAALMAAYLLGPLTQSALGLAAGLGVVITILLASREALHRFVSHKLSEDEFHDALLLGAVALVILPLVPDTGIGPFEAFNPFTAWRLVVIVVLANAAGYVAQRMFGAGLGLPLAGFFGGFVSRTATIAAMRSRATDARLLRPAVAGAVLSNIATIVQLGLVVGSTSTATLVVLAPSLIVGGVVATIYGAVLAARARGGGAHSPSTLGRPFELRSALVLGVIVSAIMVGSTILLNVLGQTGAMIAAALGGFADAHAAAISISSLVAAAKLSPSAAVAPILLGITANSITKLAVTVGRASVAFSVQVGIGIVLIIASIWGTAFLTLPGLPGRRSRAPGPAMRCLDAVVARPGLPCASGRSGQLNVVRLAAKRHWPETACGHSHLPTVDGDQPG
jgi:uncharacterized membrane protein (DUF4010 family)